MKSMSERLSNRLVKERRMDSISIRIPCDVIEDLKEVAPMLGFSGYQPLIRAYIGQGLRKDLQRLQESGFQAITESLRKQGVSEKIISAAVSEARLQSA